MLSPQPLTALPLKRTIAPLMSTLHRVALLGLRPSEHELVANAFRLPGTGPHGFALAGMMDEADLLVADAALRLVPGATRRGQCGACYKAWERAGRPGQAASA